MKNISFLDALNILKKNRIFAYPTESVFGLGCNPDNEQVLVDLLLLKKRSINKGLILIASNYKQLLPYININLLSQKQKKKILSLWPGFITFLIPCSTNISRLITGGSKFVAVRVTEHPVVRKICNIFGKPIVSTSANISGMPASRTTLEILNYFGKRIPILSGSLGSYAHSSKIFNIITGEYIRNV
ncbi:Sua5/YciO/YrdC/YwlC family protein [Buchnera aphidicola]|uniref:Sua5/YciO/YrdC/YwlC family protein n=1 Tax=Buchnera aphidicola TaxID=9 RepID=UPI00346488C0